METRQQNNLKFRGFEVLSTSFQSLQMIPHDNLVKTDFQIDAKVYKPREEPSLFSIVLELKCSAPEYFNLEIVGLGHFKISDEVVEGKRDIFINVNAPAIVFPFLRSFVSTFTSNLGSRMRTVTIPPQFFTGELEEFILEEDGEIDRTS